MATLGVALGIFLGALDSTVVATAAPTVVATLGGLELFSWVFAAYMLAATIAAPLFGKLSDQFGRRRVFLLAVGIFLASFFLAGAALFGTASFVPLFVQGVLGQPATIAGGALLPMSLCWSLGSIASGFIVGRAGFRALLC